MSGAGAGRSTPGGRASSGRGVSPGPAAVCPGTVVHHRLRPVDHRFTYPVSYVWFDPDRPDELVDAHPLWSTRWPAPAWFRRSDYLDGGTDPLGGTLRARVAAALGRAPDGPIRVLTQIRTWGWLFNPITVYLLWPADDGSRPTVAVLEVTNTPWKERHVYIVPFDPVGDPSAPLRARVAKSLHVSPFLDEGHIYDLTVRSAEGDPTAGRRRTTVELDVIERIQDGVGDEDLPDGVRTTSPPARQDGDKAPRDPIVRTRLSVDQVPVSHAALTTALKRNPLSTHRVSLGIHHQALRLWQRGVPFVAHPDRRARAGRGPGRAASGQELRP